MNVSAALSQFENTPAPSRESRLGAALALFNSQPHTEAKLHTASEQLTQLQSENPNDDTGIAAAFYLIRIRQIKNFPGATAECVADYRALLTQHPGNPIAEMAAPKLAILLLYSKVTDEIWNDRAEEIASIIPQLKSSNSQRDTRLVLAQALLKLRSDHARALPLIDYCLQHDLVVRPPRKGNLVLQAAESARILGHDETAQKYYRTFIEEFPFDLKTDEVRRRLAQLETEVRS